MGLGRGLGGIAGDFANGGGHLFHGSSQRIDILPLRGGGHLTILGGLTKLIGEHLQGFGAVVHQLDGMLLAGHQRIYALCQGAELVSCRHKIQPFGQIAIRHPA